MTFAAWKKRIDKAAGSVPHLELCLGEVPAADALTEEQRGELLERIEQHLESLRSS